MGANGAIEHLLDHVVGLVDEFLDELPRLSAALADDLPVARAPIEHVAAVRAQHAARRGGVSDEHIRVTAAERGENRRHLVESARHADAQVDAQQLLERQADHPVIERPGDRPPPCVDKTRRQHADRVAVNVALQLGGFEDPLAVEGGVRPQRRDAEQRLVGSREYAAAARRPAAQRP